MNLDRSKIGLIEFFRTWKLNYRIFYITILGLFFISGLLFTIKQGNEPYLPTDGTSEGITIFAANHFVDHGFFEHHLLPTYPPFSEGIDGKPRTEPFIYNHYLAGQDLLLGVWIKVFGKQNLGLARLIPHTLTVIAVGLLTLIFGWYFQNSLISCLLLLGLMIPRALVVWSTCLWGHSHGTAFALLTWAAFLHGALSSNFKMRDLFLRGVFGAIAISFFAVDWLPLTCFMILALAVATPGISNVQAVVKCVGLCFGFALALTYQLVISVLEFGSLHAVTSEFVKWMSLRASGAAIEAARLATGTAHLPIHKVLQEVNRQAYGATGLTTYNAMAIGAVFVLMGYFGKVRSLKSSLRAILALVFGLLATFIWPVVMKMHASGNMHFILRHTFAGFFISLFVAIPIAYDLVMNSAKNSYRPSSGINP